MASATPRNAQDRAPGLKQCFASPYARRRLEKLLSAYSGPHPTDPSRRLATTVLVLGQIVQLRAYCSAYPEHISQTVWRMWSVRELPSSINQGIKQANVGARVPTGDPNEAAVSDLMAE